MAQKKLLDLLRSCSAVARRRVRLDPGTRAFDRRFRLHRASERQRSHEPGSAQVRRDRGACRRRGEPDSRYGAQEGRTAKRPVPLGRRPEWRVRCRLSDRLAGGRHTPAVRCRRWRQYRGVARDTCLAWHARGRRQAQRDVHDGHAGRYLQAAFGLHAVEVRFPDGYDAPPGNDREVHHCRDARARGCRL